MKATAIAHSNIAFIKYWGRSDENNRLPSSGSISMNLSNLFTTTTVEFYETLKKDVITIDGQQQEKEAKRVSRHLDRIRDIAQKKIYAKVISNNSFPKSTGLSSSASGFAALTGAAVKAIGLQLSEKEVSILARQGSGSACRSIPNGFVEWKKGESSDTSYALSLFPQSYWDISDVVVIVSSEKKYIATSESQRTAGTSPFFTTRLSKLSEKIETMKKLMKEKNFTAFGELVEREALEFHAILLTSNPPLLYWLPETLKVMHMVRKMRKEGIEAYFTINTGHDVHIICKKSEKENVVAYAKKQSFKDIIVNKPSKGMYYTNKHLF